MKIIHKDICNHCIEIEKYIITDKEEYIKYIIFADIKFSYTEIEETRYFVGIYDSRSGDREVQEIFKGSLKECRHIIKELINHMGDNIEEYNKDEWKYNYRIIGE